jgi:hypothetical protein
VNDCQDIWIEPLASAFLVFNFKIENSKLIIGAYEEIENPINKKTLQHKRL